MEAFTLAQHLKFCYNLEQIQSETFPLRGYFINNQMLLYDKLP